LDVASQGFRWIRHDDVDHSVLAFERRAADGARVVVVSHFTPEVRSGYRLGLPVAGLWREVINTDLAIYGGSGVSAGEVETEAVACDGHAQSALLTLPPLATVMWVCEEAVLPSLQPLSQTGEGLFPPPLPLGEGRGEGLPDA
jgi:1,4-alpha-glucan branching enzyme